MPATMSAWNALARFARIWKVRCVYLGRQRDREKDKDRKFLAVLYPDSTEYDCEAVLRNLQGSFVRWAYILHDKDVTDAGEPKKAHYHLVLGTGNSPYQIIGIANKLGISPNYIQFCSNFRSSVRYLCHVDDLDKHPYSPNEIVSNFNVKRFFGDIEGEAMADEILKYIGDNLSLGWTAIIMWARTSGNWAVFRRDYRIFFDFYNILKSED